MSNSTDYVQIASIFLAVCGATASWAVVTQNRKGAQERRQPVLLGDASQLYSSTDEETSAFLTILNTGGTAVNVACVLAIGNRYVANSVGHGFLRFQQEAKVEVEMPQSPDKRAILICRDMKRRICVWDLNKNMRRYKDETTGPDFNFNALWLNFYGEDLSRLTRVSSKVTV